MYNAETMQAVRSAAQMLTEQNRVATVPNPASPLGQFVDSYNIDDVGTRSPLTDELMASVESHFEEINPEPTELRQEDNKLNANSVGYGIGIIQYNAKNVIVPAIADMATNYGERQKQSASVDMVVDSYNYALVHSEETLTTHLERYRGLSPLPAYRTFLLVLPEIPEIIRMVSENNPHLDAESVQKWTLTLSPDEIRGLWTELFGTTRTLNPYAISFLKPNDPAATADRLLFAYCLAGHLITNVMDVQGESVSEEEWEDTITRLHEFLGSALLATYTRRAEDRQNRIVVLNSDMQSPIQTRRVRLLLNGDVARDWLDAGGDVQAILGAQSDSPNTIGLADIEANAEYYVEKWRQLYPNIQQAALDYADSVARRNLREAFVEVALATDALDKTGITDLSGRVFDMVRSLYPADLKNPYRSFGLLICRLFYTDDVYWDYLTYMEEAQQRYPEATARELSTQSLLTIVAIWLSKQISIIEYQPDISVTPAYVPEVEVEETIDPTGAEIATQVEEAVTESAEDGIVVVDGVRGRYMPTDEHGEMPPGFVPLPAEVVEEQPMTMEETAAFHAQQRAYQDEAAAADEPVTSAIDPDTGAAPVV